MDAQKGSHVTCDCLCSARTLQYYQTCVLASPMYTSRMSRHWYCWNHCQDQRHSWGSTTFSYSSPEWVWNSGSNLWHWKTDSNQSGKRRANPCPLWVMSPSISVTFISQATEFITACYGKHVEGSTIVTDCRQTIWAYKTCRGTVSAHQTWFTANNISCISWKCKMLPLAGVQLEIGIAPRPSINESNWIWLGSRHRDQNFVGKKTF